MNSYQLSVCAEMVFLDLPFVERVKRIHALGFGVEIWGWAGKDIDALAATGARFTSMTGYLSGNLTDDDDIRQLLQSAEASLAIAERLRCPALNLHGTGLDDKGLPVKPVEVVTGAMWLKAVETLRQLARMGERAGRIFTLENLNLPVDHPGTPFALAADTLALVSAVNSPALKMNLDLYHAQIGEGNLIELIRKSQKHIGEIQVADVPGRKEPGTGEINYKAVARALREIDYHGTVALEGWASDDSAAALEAFREVFTQ
ncbi:TIM barrel protein [Erwinia sp. ACCC 02193]|jgi:hydroxypyruvate isomerase|uniref:TIM barrel protein n=2 Tax=Erwinia TaxID=551 RepID=A0ABV4EEN9_9GAMM|nr:MULTISPECIES: TIM barrel protein [unclassified Erwinia]MDN4629025.1 TIM barrel protein [Erwinia sp. PsM31]MDN8543916.1 TIM barrel protein [Erwinia sp. BC051422]